MANEFTTKRIADGEFECFWNGVSTGDLIINGSRGLSGRDTRNVYGIRWNSGKLAWIGTLAACKKAVAFNCQRKAKARPVSPAAEFFRKASEIEWEPI
jgi:hypothetical protein